MIDGLVSTIIPVYNRGPMLRNAVASVLAQKWRPIEIVIVDDGSTDETPHVAAALCADYPGIVRLHHQANSGPGPARQAGFQASKGEFVQFLDSDDLILPNKFEVQVQGLRLNKDAGISYGRTYCRVEGVRVAHPSPLNGQPHREIFPAILLGRFWETSTPLYRRDALLKIGPWSNKRQLEDWEFDARAGAEGIRLQYCDEYLAEYVHHDEERLGLLWLTSAGAMRDRVAAYISVHGHAIRAGVQPETPEMQEFARALFWMARSAGSYGLSREAGTLFQLARSTALHPGWEYRFFSAAVAGLGWQRTSRIAERFRAWRRE